MSAVATMGDFSKQLARIQEFEQEHSRIKQHSEEWYGLMRHTVGGSDLGALWDVNRYRKPQEVVHDIVNRQRGLSKPFSSSACGFGSAFEPAAFAYTTEYLGCQVYCRESCIQNIPGVSHFRYSPDGIGVVWRTASGALWTTTTQGGRQARAYPESALFEAKNPVSRRPDGAIPKQYKPQVWGGLVATEGLTRNCIFIDAVFRLCTEDSLGELPGYNTSFHSRDTREMYTAQPKAWGLLNVFMKVAPKGNRRPIDFGAADSKTIESMLAAVSSGEYATSLASITLRDGATIQYSSQSNTDNMHYIGVMPYKLVKIYFITVKPEPNFRQRLAILIGDCFKEVNALLAKPDETIYL